MQTHKVSGDEVRQIEGYAFTYRAITTDPLLLGVVSDYAISTISQMIQGDIDPSEDSVLMSVDALQAVIELAYLKGIQEGEPEKQTVYRCHRCSADLIYKDGAYRTIIGEDAVCTSRGISSTRHIAGVL